MPCARAIYYPCFFIYSTRAFSISSLILRAEPVLLTTNLIHCCQTPLSILIEVFALVFGFSSLWLIGTYVLSGVDKVGGIYHKLHIRYHVMVMWYNGNPSDLQAFHMERRP